MPRIKSQPKPEPKIPKIASKVAVDCAEIVKTILWKSKSTENLRQMENINESESQINLEDVDAGVYPQKHDDINDNTEIKEKDCEETTVRSQNSSAEENEHIKKVLKPKMLVPKAYHHSDCIKDETSTSSCSNEGSKDVLNIENTDQLKVSTSNFEPYDESLYQEFGTGTPLKVYEYIGTKEKPYVCKVCLKMFAQSDSLAEHEYLHTGEKPYSCSFCSIKFKYLINLKAHESTHTGTGPQYPCTMCLTNLMRSSQLSRRMRRCTLGK